MLEYSLGHHRRVMTTQDDKFNDFVDLTDDPLPGGPTADPADDARCEGAAPYSCKASCCTLTDAEMQRFRRERTVELRLRRERTVGMDKTEEEVPPFSQQEECIYCHRVILEDLVTKAWELNELQDRVGDSMRALKEMEWTTQLLNQTRVRRTLASFRGSGVSPCSLASSAILTQGLAVLAGRLLDAITIIAKKKMREKMEQEKKVHAAAGGEALAGREALQGRERRPCSRRRMQRPCSTDPPGRLPTPRRDAWPRNLPLKTRLPPKRRN
jgi:hypothetical protein